MSEQDNSRLTVFLYKTALDWIPIIFDETRFLKDPRPTADRQKEIQKQVAHLTGEPLDKVVVYIGKLLDEDDKRRATIESKAFSLIGIAGIASSFIIGFAQFLFGNISPPGGLHIVVITLYALIGISLLITLTLARQVILVNKYPLMSPIPSDLLKLTEKNRDYIYRQHAADMLLSYEYNMAVVNDKASYAKGAQDWFRNTVVLLFVLLMVFTIYLIFKPNWDVPISPEPIPVIVVTATPSPTNTATLTPTATNTPTLLPTSTPSATPTSVTP